MNGAVPTPARRPAPRTLAFVALGGLGVLGIALNAYLGRGPAPVTVTATSGAATFNFRVTGIPVPGRVLGVTPKLTFSPRDLAAATGTVTVNLAGLDTGIALRDEHARNFLGVQKHPDATFALSRIEGAARIAPGQTLNATARGTLDLNGRTVPLAAPVTLAYAADGAAIDVETTFDVAFEDHAIEIPGADPRTDVSVRFRLPINP